MKQQNFLFVDIVSSIFLTIISIGNFIGLQYITEGNFAISLLVSLLLIVCYFFVVKLLKNNKEIMLRKNFMHASLLFWVFFIFLAVVSFTLMSHFINIEYNCKNQIKSEASQKISLVDSLLEVYKKRSKDDIQNFEAQLKTKLNDYKSTKSNVVRNELTLEPYLINTSTLNTPDYINVNSVTNSKVNPYQKIIEKNIQNIDSTIALNSKKYKSVFDNWKRLSLMNTYIKLNEYVDANVKLINSKIEDLPLDKTKINITYNKNILPLNNPFKLNKQFQPNFLVPFAVIVIIHLFILIPFLSHKVRGYKKNSSDKQNRGNRSERGTNQRKGTIEL